MYCRYCQGVIPENSVVCPKCGKKCTTEQKETGERKIQQKEHKKTAKGKGKKRRVLLGLLLFALLSGGIVSLFLCFCQKDEESAVYKEAMKIVEAIQQKNMDEIDRMIFSDGVVEDIILKKDAALLYNKEYLQDIVDRSEIEIRQIDEEKIVYHMETPDMRSFFTSMLYENMTYEEFEDYAANYLKEATTTGWDVTVNYTYEDGIFEANYKTGEFADAVTGGLLKAYPKYFQESLMD